MALRSFLILKLICLARLIRFACLLNRSAFDLRRWLDLVARWLCKLRENNVPDRQLRFRHRHLCGSSSIKVCTCPLHRFAIFLSLSAALLRSRSGIAYSVGNRAQSTLDLGLLDTRPPLLLLPLLLGALFRISCLIARPPSLSLSVSSSLLNSPASLLLIFAMSGSSSDFVCSFLSPLPPILNTDRPRAERGAR